MTEDVIFLLKHFTVQYELDHSTAAKWRGIRMRTAVQPMRHTTGTVALS